MDLMKLGDLLFQTDTYGTVELLLQAQTDTHRYINLAQKHTLHKHTHTTHAHTCAHTNMNLNTQKHTHLHLKAGLPLGHSIRSTTSCPQVSEALHGE